MQKLSILIPVYNESSSLETLCKMVLEHVPATVELYEILFVDDGSTDGSFDIIAKMAANNPTITALRLAVNSGKAEALAVGFQHARGDIIITMDADLQDDPKEIPRFIDELAKGFDLVSGWKQNRQDPWHKTWPSKIFNTVIAKLFGLPLRDMNCGFKAYKRELAEKLYLYGELHRYIPVLAQSMGARIKDIPVEHHPRKFGVSKYGVSRLLKGFLDMITVWVITRFLKRPLHLFGSIGLLCSSFGALALAYLAFLWVGGIRPIGNRPLLFYGIALLLLGVQVLSLGIVAELFIRFNHRTVKPVIVERVGARKANQ